MNQKPSKFMDNISILNADGKLFCPITGYKCHDETCDCKSLCKGKYSKFKIYPDENVIMFSEKLAPGTYCLPVGFEHCNVQKSIPIYSVNGWICISKNPAIWNADHFVACQNPYAQDNSLNFLLDTKTNTQVTNDIINDYYELYNGKMRYQCSCNSLDKSGNKLVHLDDVPFKCVSDYCLAKLTFRRGISGWNNSTKQCDCGHLLHENPNDLTSPCIEQSYKLQQNVFSGTVNCMNNVSLKEYPIYCNNTSGILTFQKTFIFSDNPLEYLNKTI